MLEQLRELLKHKKSQAYYAEKLGINVEEVKELMKELREEPKTELKSLSEIFPWLGESFEQKVDNEKGTLTSTAESNFEPKSDEELATLHKVNLDKYRISNYYSKLKPNGKFTSTVFCALIKKDSEENFQKEFLTFLKEDLVVPKSLQFKYQQAKHKSKVSLILPRQDAHFNKLDINGDNDIHNRFLDDAFSTNNFIKKAKATNHLEEIVYIVGSDQFNSEWTSLTTKGTPQQNILSYQEAFKLICEHESSMLLALSQECDKLKVVFVPGNHDHYVGWHLINWLEAYLSTSGIEFESSVVCTKYHKYGNTAIMLNHGDAIKPAGLATKFPIGFKSQWSYCENFYIFTGDKHTELSMDLNGIKFYRVPQLSTSTSLWDDKKGYTDSKAENTAFVITKENGMSDIYKEVIS